MLHCSDGWSYLGKALLSILRGDPHRAVHLAYYAELRAAVSLLATEGIGIFNNRHFVIDGPGSVARMHDKNSATHQFTWNCLDYWANLPSSGALFANIIKPHGRTLDDWLYPLGGGSAIAPKAREWFRQWGMDLKKLPEDRDARNESSYQPDGIPDAWRVDAAKVLRFACDLWWALEPSAESRFNLIDRHILRIALNSIFNGRTGRSAEENAEEFREFIIPVIDHQSFATAARQQWLDFMIRTIIPDDPLIFKFSRESSGTRVDSDLAVISRAVLLLRFASGSASQIIETAGVGNESIDFWWKILGQGRGLWDGDKKTNELLDLWADVESCLAEVRAFQSGMADADQTFYRIGNDIGGSLLGLGSCELVAIWSAVPG